MDVKARDSDHQSSPETRGSVSVGRRRGARAVSVLLGVSLLSGGIGWVAARQISSPAEVAARAKAPSASRITAPVELRVLRSTLFTRGTVRFGSPRAVTLPASAAKTGSLVVTSPPKKGGEIIEGAKVADIGGRPVMVLQGNVPMYRDLRPGDQGADVLALKAALNRLGFASGTGDLYDTAAQRGVSAWMRLVGYEPFGPSETQQDRLRTATDAIRKSTEQILAAQDALTRGVTVVTPDKVLAADEAIRAAIERADSTRREADRSLYAAQAAVVSKRNSVELAQIAIDRNATDVSQVLTVTEADLAIVNAKQRVIDSDAAVEKSKAAVVSAQIDSEEATLIVREAEIAVAEAKLGVVAAQAQLDRIKAQGPKTIETSPGVFTGDFESFNASIAQAEAGIKQATTQVRSAETALRAAQRSETKARQAISDASASVTAATFAAGQAREQVKIAELRLIQARTGGGSGGGSGGGVSGGGVSGGTPPSGSASTGSSGAAAGGASSGDSAASNPSDATQTPAPAPTPSARAAAPIGGTSSAQLALALRIAQEEAVQADKNLESTERSAAASIRSADAAIRIARSQRTEMLKPASTASLRAAVKSAESGRESAEAELARLEATIGIVVPANELLFFETLPLRIDDTKLVAGDALSGALMTVASQRVAVDASVDPSDATTLRVGQVAEIEATDLGITLPATITRVATTTGTNGADASRIYVEVSPVEADPADTDTAVEKPADSGDGEQQGQFLPGRKPTLADLNGISVKVTIPISSTSGDVLAVPTPAVSAAADGTIRVEVETEPGKPTRFVSVNAGLRAEGYVEVTPTEAGTLEAGDLVVTGTRDGEQLVGTLEPNDKPSVKPPTTDP